MNVGEAVKLIEPVCRWQALRSAAEVPLPKDCRSVAGVLEELAHGEGLPGKRVGRAFDGDQRQTVADGVLPCHQCSTRWRAGRLDQKLGQPQSLLGQLVQTRRGRAAQLSTAVRAEVAVTDIVRQDETLRSAALP